MIIKPIKVLLVLHEPLLAKRIRYALADERLINFTVVWVQQLADGAQRMNNAQIDVVLLDLSLSNGQSAEFVEHLLYLNPSALIILLCTSTDSVYAHEAMAQGACDCVDKKGLDKNWLRRVIGYNLMLDKADKIHKINVAKLRAIGSAASHGIMVSDVCGNITYTNQAYQQLTGFSADTLHHQHWASAIHADDRSRLRHEWRNALQRQHVFHSELRLTCQDKSSCRVTMTGAFIKDARGFYGHVRTFERLEDLSSDVPLQLPLLTTNQTRLPLSAAQLTLDDMNNAVLCTDINGNVAYLNHAAERLTGWKSNDALGCVLAQILHIKALDNTKPPLKKRKLEQVSDSLLIRKDGGETLIEESVSPLHNEYGQVVGDVFVFQDVSKSRVKSIKMTHLAQHDSLTGLPNRILLNERLTQSIKLAKRHNKLLALLYIDIDSFKQVNDQNGHEMGDKLLCSIAKRMSDTVRNSDTVCRQGGDEFVLLLSEIEHANDAANLSSKLLASISQPHLIDGKEILVSLSIGIAIFPHDGTVNKTLIDNADNAMFHAKANGRNAYQFFKESMHAATRHRMNTEERIKRALKGQEFVLHYQAQFDLISRKVTGAEALIRWQDPELGLLYPAEFIPVAEQSQLICAIGDWVRSQVCRQQTVWQERGLAIVPVMINTAAIEFSEPHFIHNITSLLQTTGLTPHYLGLEVIQQDITLEAYPVIKELKALGLSLALDDFGLGTSHLSLLQNLAFDTIKIAPQLLPVSGAENDEVKIARATIGLAENLGQYMVAKGVENQQQLNFLKQHRCYAAQGFLLARPTAAETFAQLLSNTSVQQKTAIKNEQ